MLDTANLAELEAGLAAWPICGVTSNPSILKKEGKVDVYAHLAKVKALCGPERSLHVQVVSETTEEIVKEAHDILDRLGKDTFIKIPVSAAGLPAIKILAAEGVKITATAIYSTMQGILAVLAGAYYIDNLQMIPLFPTTLPSMEECEHADMVKTVVEPTCAKAGYTYNLCYTCAYSAYTDEVEATGEHNYVDGVCDVCGAEDIPEVPAGPEKADDLNFIQAPSLSFQDYIGMQVMISSALRNSYEELYVEATQIDPEKGAVTTKLSGMLYYFDMFLVFDQQILSWSMAEEVTLTLYGVKEGKTFVGQTYTYSVETLALAMLNAYKDSNAKLCKVLVDMLNYGAAVQTTYNHNAALLPNTQLSAYAHLGTAGDPALNATVSKEGTGPVAIAQVSISMQSKVEIQLLFAQNISAYTAKAAIGSKELTAVVDTETMGAYGYTIVRVAIGAANMRDNITIALYDANGNAVTTVYTVSAEAFAKSLATGAQGAVALAMMRYGDAVKAYAG
jgi:hypothetical protein